MARQELLHTLASKLKTVGEPEIREIVHALDSEMSTTTASNSSSSRTAFSSPAASSMMSTSTSSSSPDQHRRKPADQLVKSTKLISELQQSLSNKNVDLEQLRRKINVLETTLAATTSRCEQFKRDLGLMAREKAEMLKHYQTQELELKQANEAIQMDLAQITAAQEQAETRMTTFKQNLKDKLHAQMFISDEMHATLSTLAPEDLDVVQFVQVRVYNEISRWKTECEEKTRLFEALKKESDVTADTLRRAQQLWDHQHAADKDEIEQLKSEKDRLERKNDLLIRQLEEVSSNYDAAKGKGFSFDKVQEQLEASIKQNNQLATENEMLKQKLDFVTQERNEFKVESNSDKHGMQNAANELKFVTRENEYLVGRIKELEAEKQFYEETKRELKKAKQEALDRLYAERAESSAQYEAKLQKETERLKNENQRDLDLIREQCREISERESKSLREARDNAIQEAERLRRKYKDAKDEKEQTLAEFKNLQDATRVTITELQGSLKTREFELDRARMTVEEQKRLNAELKLENEICTKKLEVLRQEFYDAQTAHAAREAELQTSIQGYREKISIYSALETDTDELICKFGGSIAGTTNEAEQFSSVNEASKAINFVPTATSRRVQQAIHLARQATQLQAQVLQLREELDMKSKTEQTLRAELSKLKDIVGNTPQPYSYFITTLQEKDSEIGRLNKTLGDLQSKYDSLMADQEILTKDLETLIEQRHEILRLKDSLLKHLQTGSVSAGKSAVFSGRHFDEPLATTTTRPVSAPFPTTATAQRPLSPLIDPAITGAGNLFHSQPSYGAAAGGWTAPVPPPPPRLEEDLPLLFQPQAYLGPRTTFGGTIELHPPRDEYELY